MHILDERRVTFRQMAPKSAKRHTPPYARLRVRCRQPIYAASDARHARYVSRRERHYATPNMPPSLLDVDEDHAMLVYAIIHRGYELRHAVTLRYAIATARTAMVCRHHVNVSSHYADIFHQSRHLHMMPP